MELTEELQKYKNILTESKKTICKDCECDPCACETMNESADAPMGYRVVTDVQMNFVNTKTNKKDIEHYYIKKPGNINFITKDANEAYVFPTSQEAFTVADRIKVGGEFNEGIGTIIRTSAIPITMNESVESEKKYVVVRSGGSIGEKPYQSEPMSQEDAVAKAKRMNSQLTTTEREGYRINYAVRLIKESNNIDVAKGIQDGDRVKVKDEGGEIFRVSQCDERRCWIGDSQGRGWYISLNRLEKVGGKKKIREFKEECDHAWGLKPGDKTKMVCKLCKETKPVEKRVVKESDDQGNPWHEKTKEFQDWETGKTDTCPQCKKEPCSCKKLPKKVSEADYRGSGLAQADRSARREGTSWETCPKCGDIEHEGQPPCRYCGGTGQIQKGRQSAPPEGKPEGYEKSGKSTPYGGHKRNPWSGKIEESKNICEWCEGEELQMESCPECFGSGKKLNEVKDEEKCCVLYQGTKIIARNLSQQEVLKRIKKLKEKDPEIRYSWKKQPEKKTVKEHCGVCPEDMKKGPFQKKAVKESFVDLKSTDPEKHDWLTPEERENPKDVRAKFGASYYDPVRDTTIGYGLHRPTNDNEAMRVANKIADQKGYELLRVDDQKTLRDLYVSPNFQKYFPGSKKKPLEFKEPQVNEERIAATVAKKKKVTEHCGVCPEDMKGKKGPFQKKSKSKTDGTESPVSKEARKNVKESEECQCDCHVFNDDKVHHCNQCGNPKSPRGKKHCSKCNFDPCKCQKKVTEEKANDCLACLTLKNKNLNRDCQKCRKEKEAKNK